MLHFTNKKHSRLLKPNAYLAVHDLNIYIRKHTLHKRNIEKKKLLSMAERQGQGRAQNFKDGYSELQ
jgi:hypothetical protein